MNTDCTCRRDDAADVDVADISLSPIDDKTRFEAEAEELVPVLVVAVVDVVDGDDVDAVDDDAVVDAVVEAGVVVVVAVGAAVVAAPPPHTRGGTATKQHKTMSKQTEKRENQNTFCWKSFR